MLSPTTLTGPLGRVSTELVTHKSIPYIPVVSCEPPWQKERQVLEERNRKDVSDVEKGEGRGNLDLVIKDPVINFRLTVRS